MAHSQRDIALAHVLFLVAGLGPLATGIANIVPMSTGTAGGVGLLLLVPLTLAGFVAIVIGVIRTIRLGAPGSLVVLSILSIGYVAAFFTSDGDLLPVWLRRSLSLALGVAITATAIYGLARARKEEPQDSAN